jgi:N-methylhydantoinase B
MFEGQDPLKWRREVLGRSRTVFMDNSPGGMGGRRAGDGVSGIKVHTGNARVPSIETAEFSVPIRAVRWARVPDTGGAGRERGGCGIAREWEILDDDVHATLMSERARVPAFGLGGGDAGRTAIYGINVGTDRERLLPSKTPPITLGRGDRYLMQSAGGGGRGSAWARPAEAVLADVLDGYVTERGARDDYGVVIVDGAVDAAATDAARAGMRDLAPPVAAGTVERGPAPYDAPATRPVPTST